MIRTQTEELLLYLNLLEMLLRLHKIQMPSCRPPDLNTLAHSFSFVITIYHDKEYLNNAQLLSYSQCSNGYESLLAHLPANGIPAEVLQKIIVQISKAKRDSGLHQAANELESTRYSIQSIVKTLTVQHCASGLNTSDKLRLKSTSNVYQKSIMQKAISEFADPLFFYKAFPYLCWNGEDDLNCQRPVRVQIGEQLEHKLSFVSSRFCSHPAFVAIASNTVSRHDNVKNCKPLVGNGILQKHIVRFILRDLRQCTVFSPVDASVLQMARDHTILTKDLCSCCRNALCSSCQFTQQFKTFKNGVFGVVRRIAANIASAFVDFDHFPGLEFETPQYPMMDSSTGFCRIQFPIVLGYAATIHKVQSQTVAG
ncbi:hypothetical protein MP228_004976 [Amoeboaphelidium protococcarum]|nr:hypothetical protein MP228_004976 [Amoeboaphelidium protococcarum]